MDSTADLLERRIPDVVSTAGLPPAVAAEIDFLAGRNDRRIDSTAVGVGLRARALAASGEFDAARSLLEEFDPDDACEQELMAAAWAVSRAGPVSLAFRLLDIAEQFGSTFVIDKMPLGPADSSVGLLRSATGDLDGAAHALRDAAVVGDARAPIWGALARLELARVLSCATAVGRPVDEEGLLGEANRALVAAKTFFVAGGYRSLLVRADNLGSDPVRAVLASGEQWTVGFGVQPTVPAKPSKGLRALQHLLENRHRPVSSAELICLLDGGDAETIAELATGAVLGQLEDGAAGDAGLTERLRATFFDDANRSRVTKLVRRTIVKLGESHRLLGEHLDGAICTGHVCRYAPVGEVAVRWEF